MNKTCKTTLLTLSFLVIFLTIPRPAHAYIGPGTLTLALQILAGLLVGGITVMAMYWSKIKEYFTNKDKKRDQ